MNSKIESTETVCNPSQYIYNFLPSCGECMPNNAWQQIASMNQSPFIFFRPLRIPWEKEHNPCVGCRVFKNPSHQPLNKWSMRPTCAALMWWTKCQLTIACSSICASGGRSTCFSSSNVGWTIHGCYSSMIVSVMAKVCIRSNLHCTSWRLLKDWLGPDYTLHRLAKWCALLTRQLYTSTAWDLPYGVNA